MLTKSSVLERILRPSEGNLPPDLARRVLELDFAPSDHARYHELSLRVQSGELSEDERLELTTSSPRTTS